MANEHDEQSESRFPRRPWVRMVRGADRDGPLFTPDDLIAAFRWGHITDTNGPTLQELTREPVDAPNRTWPEDWLILIALVVKERRERIREHLKFSPEALASAFERVRASLPGEGVERAPEVRNMEATRIQRLVSAADDEGELFTADELFDALRHGYTEAEARELTADWTTGGIDTPGKAWTENVLVMIALNIPDRAERIRRHLGFSIERMEKELAHERGFCSESE